MSGARLVAWSATVISLPEAAAGAARGYQPPGDIERALASRLRLVAWLHGNAERQPSIWRRLGVLLFYSEPTG